MNFYLINPDAEHRGILLIKTLYPDREIKIPWIERKTETEPKAIKFSPPTKKLVYEHVLINKDIEEKGNG